MSVHNIEAEQSLIGAILINNDAYHLISDVLEPDHFYEPLHRRLFDLCQTQINEGRRANPITLKTFLDPSQRIGQFTSIEYMNKLVSCSTSLMNVTDWGQLIKDLWIRRKAIGLLETATINLRDVDQGLMNTLEGAGQAVMELEADATIDVDGETLHTHLDRQIEHIADVYQSDREAGISTGLDFIDRLTGPWFPGNLILIGGGTKMGKTALAMQCLSGLSRHHSVLVFSFEMQGQQLAAREISKRTNVSTHRQNLGKVNDREYEMISNAPRQEDGNISVITRSMDLDAIERTIIRQKKLKALDCVVVDHIGLIDPLKGDKGKAEWELGTIATRRLKKMAMQHDVTIVALAQLKKNAMHQAWTSNFEHTLKACFKRPRYSDLIGGVERDTDHVIIPFRPEALLKEVEPQEGSEDHFAWLDAVKREEGKASIILALSRERNWPILQDVNWSGEKTEFSSGRPQRMI